MRREYRFASGALVVVEFNGQGWTAEVKADNMVRCQYDREHIVPIHETLNINAHIVNEDKAMLAAYEWAIRGSDRAAGKLLTLIVDDVMMRTFIDPCEVP